MFIWPYLSFATKKSFMVGWVESDFSVSLCPFSKKRSKIKMDNELDNVPGNHLNNKVLGNLNLAVIIELDVR